MRIEKWHMPQKSMRHIHSTSIGGRIASSNELDAVDLDPNVVLPPKTPVFDKLPHEHNDTLSAVLVLLREIDFIAKDNKPTLGTKIL